MKIKLLYFLVISLAFLALSSCGKSKPCIDPASYDPHRACSNFVDPVCGCDDIQYRNACEAERNGVQLWIQGPC
ncbi:MAG: kazal domain protein [Chitinophagaceae bacterium]|nr:MAG: kazal domain protein [Chitinophagaceae bacterium]